MQTEQGRRKKTLSCCDIHQKTKPIRWKSSLVLPPKGTAVHYMESNFGHFFKFNFTVTHKKAQNYNLRYLVCTF